MLCLKDNNHLWHCIIPVALATPMQSAYVHSSQSPNLLAYLSLRSGPHESCSLTSLLLATSLRVFSLSNYTRAECGGCLLAGHLLLRGEGLGWLPLRCSWQKRGVPWPANSCFERPRLGWQRSIQLWQMYCTTRLRYVCVCVHASPSLPVYFLYQQHETRLASCVVPASLALLCLHTCSSLALLCLQPCLLPCLI